MKLTVSTLAVLGILGLTACQTISQSARGPRTILVGGDLYSEAKLGRFVTWRCKDFIYGGRTVVEVGIMPSVGQPSIGFVLLDGGDTGEETIYRRLGLEHRWDWGGKSGGDFAVVIKTDGTGLYYDFSNAPEGEQIKARDVFKCSQ